MPNKDRHIKDNCEFHRIIRVNDKIVIPGTGNELVNLLH